LGSKPAFQYETHYQGGLNVNVKLFGTSRARKSLSLVALAAALAYPADASAQDGPPVDRDAPEATGQASAAPTVADAPPANADDQGIVVTGSRIRRPNLESSVPVTSVGGEEFFETGQIAIGEKLNELPQLRSTLGQQQSAVTGLGNSGLNLLDLRGLGTQRTLVLVNGRRHVGGDLQVNATSPDINTIPTALIERVDVVTGGNSAIYGSDAIAGVVNFLLRHNFEGVEARGQGGISHYGDAAAYFASLTGGHNFADGRGNVAASVEYGRQERYFGAGRPYILSQDAFLTVDTDPAGSPNGSDGNPDTQYFRDIRSATTNNTGLVIFDFQNPTATANCGTDPVGAFYTCPYTFQPDGTLVPITGTRVGLGPNGSFVGGNGESFRGGEQYELAPKVDRLVANLLGHYEVARALELFTELKYSRIQSVGTGNTGPGFIVSAGNAGDVRQMFRLDNPFLSTQARDLITQQLLASGRTTGTIGGAGGALSAADRANIANGSFRVRLSESFLNLGRREQSVERETYRAVVGLRGTFNTDWTYEVSANYGDYRESETRAGNPNRQRLLLGLDAARNPATGQIQCRSQFDPAARVGLSTAGPDLTPARRAEILAADIAACVPLNPFGGQFTPEQVNYIIQDTYAHGSITQFVANGFLSGDSSDWFELPGGPVGFAVGAEYRRETNFYELDPFSREGYTVFNAVSTFTAPALKVKEVFGELRIPLLAHMPFFEELTFSGAARYADYAGKTGGVLAYNAGVEWAPVRDIRLRGNYSRAVRAPLLGELYTAQSPGFIAIPNDPCSLRFRGQGTTNRAANCLALGVPANYDFVYSSTPIGLFGGNPDLKEESSKSLTVGAVMQPRFLPGLSLSVDYYDITVKNVISSVAPQTALNQCVDLPSINNQFCSLFKRNQGPAAGPAGEEVGRVLEGSFLVSSLNFAARKARGIDFELGYRHQIAGFGKIDLRGTWTHALQRSNFESPVDPKFENVILHELNDPQDEVLVRASLDTGPVDFTWTGRYIGKQLLGTYESIHPLNGLPATNADQFANPYYPEVLYHNVRIGFDIGRNSEFYVGVDNLLDKAPPLGVTGIGAGSGIYDNRGRFYYSGVHLRF
jgi:outer membrane receptor protein involved in Fe transport